jgi:hypothetical protein
MRVVGGIVVAAVLAASCVVPVAAHSAVTNDSRVGVKASRTSVDLGESVRLSGAASGIPVGRRVVVQRRAADDSWSPVTTARIRKTHTWRARVEPEAGHQDYRARVMLRSGTATSRSITVAASWQPEVTIEHSQQLRNIPDSEYALWFHRLGGMAEDGEGDRVRLQVLDEGSWRSTGHVDRVGADDTFALGFWAEPPLRDALVRVCLPRDGLRRASCSPVVSTGSEPLVPQLDLVSAVSSIREDPTGVVIPRQVQEVQLSGHTNLPAGVGVEFSYRVPGTQVWEFLHRHRLPNTGAFTITTRTPPDGVEVRMTVEGMSDISEAVSEPVGYTMKPFQVSLGDPALVISNVPTYRGALLEFEADAGQVLHLVSTRDGNVSIRQKVEGPDGAVLEQKEIQVPFTAPWVVPYYVAPTGGTYQLVVFSDQYGSWAGATAYAVAPEVWSGPATHDTIVTTSFMKQTAEYRFAGTAGQVVTLFRQDHGESCGYVDLIQGSDVESPVPALLGPVESYGQIWQLPADGEYRWRVAPCRDATLDFRLWSVAPAEKELTVTNREQVTTAPAGAWLKWTFRLDVGDHVRLEWTDSPDRELGTENVAMDGVNSYRLFAPDGSSLPFDFTATQAGTYTFWGEQAGYGDDAASTFRVLLRRMNP